jgi:hypothetical protein
MKDWNLFYKKGKRECSTKYFATLFNQKHYENVNGLPGLLFDRLEMLWLV